MYSPQPSSGLLLELSWLIHTGLPLGISRCPAQASRRHVRHPWEKLYSLVLDVESYPRFVPFCQATHVLEHSNHNGDDTVIVRVDVGFMAVRERFTSRILGRRARREILISHLEGPLRHFDARWLFRPADDCATDVGLEIDYQFHNHLMSAMAGMVFMSASGEFVAAFERRAAQVLA